MKSYRALIEQKQHEHGDRFDPSSLAAQFIPYYESESRIEVDFGEGIIKRGRVGVTTGWKPVFLLMLTKRSIGSAWTLSPRDTIRKVVSP